LESKGKKMKVIKKLLGIDKIEQDLIKAKSALEEAEAKKIEAERSAALAREQEELAKMSPKDRATRKKEPWVGVLNTHVNKDNVRNGFFELDWNQYFIVKLKQDGYGVEGDPDEEIIDRWFRELCANVVVDGDYGGPVITGSLDIETVKRNNQ
jgi:hypothetical protein